MRKFLILIILSIAIISCNKQEKYSVIENQETETKAEFSIAIHGGAGTILKKNMTLEKEAAYKAKLEEAIRTGYTILKNGGSSIDAVQKTIICHGRFAIIQFRKRSSIYKCWNKRARCFNYGWENLKRWCNRQELQPLEILLT